MTNDSRHSTAARRILGHLLGTDDSTSVVVWVGHDGIMSALLQHGDLAAALVERERVLGVGPGTDALRTGADHVVHDLAHERWATRWPFVSAWAGEHGVRSCIVAPIVIDDRVIGGVTAVASSHRAWSLPCRALRRYGLAALCAETVTSCPDALTHQAIGLLAAQHHLDTEGATALLRSSAFAADVGLGTAASEVVDAHLRSLTSW